METRLTEVEKKVELIEFKVDLHNQDINKLLIGIEKLVKATESLEAHKNRLTYYVQAAIVVFLVSELGLTKILLKLM